MIDFGTLLEDDPSTTRNPGTDGPIRFEWEPDRPTRHCTCGNELTLEDERAAGTCLRCREAEIRASMEGDG